MEEERKKGTWSVFGGVFDLGNEKWQVIPHGGEDGKPKFIKCS